MKGQVKALEKVVRDGPFVAPPDPLTGMEKQVLTAALVRYLKGLDDEDIGRRVAARSLLAWCTNGERTE